MDEEFKDIEENVYSEDCRKEFIESDGISPEEEGFMQGYDAAEGESDEKDSDSENDKEEEDEDEFEEE